MAKLSGRGKGKWQNERSFARYLAKRNRKNKIANASRRRNVR